VEGGRRRRTDANPHEERKLKTYTAGGTHIKKSSYVQWNGAALVLLRFE
jgi:hypothetical protein